MRGFLAAWVVGEGIYIWRAVHKSHHLPVPGILVGITGLFAAMAAAAEIFPGAEQVITLTAWGLDLAGFLNVLPAGLGGQIAKTEAEQPPQLAG